MPHPHTEFDWAIYANATLAGLTPLIPIPFLDWAFERFFRRRMLPAIADCRQVELSPLVVTEINRIDKKERGCLNTCLMAPLWGMVVLIKRLSRKLVYVLAIQEATDKLSYYWHVAFLLDYMLLSGHLESEASARVAREAMTHALTERTTTSPLLTLAKQITASTRHIFRSLIGAGRGREDEVIEEKKLQMLEHWDDFSEYFEQLAIHYDQDFQKIQARPDPTDLV